MSNYKKTAESSLKIVLILISSLKIVKDNGMTEREEFPNCIAPV